MPPCTRGPPVGGGHPGGLRHPHPALRGTEFRHLRQRGQCPGWDQHVLPRARLRRLLRVERPEAPAACTWTESVPSRWSGPGTCNTRRPVSRPPTRTTGRRRTRATWPASGGTTNSFGCWPPPWPRTAWPTPSPTSTWSRGRTPALGGPAILPVGHGQPDQHFHSVNANRHPSSPCPCRSARPRPTSTRAATTVRSSSRRGTGPTGHRPVLAGEPQDGHHARRQASIPEHGLGIRPERFGRHQPGGGHLPIASGSGLPGHRHRRHALGGHPIGDGRLLRTDDSGRSRPPPSPSPIPSRGRSSWPSGPTADGAQVTVVTGTQFAVDLPAVPPTSAPTDGAVHVGGGQLRIGRRRLPPADSVDPRPAAMGSPLLHRHGRRRVPEPEFPAPADQRREASPSIVRSRGNLL